MLSSIPSGGAESQLVAVPTGTLPESHAHAKKQRWKWIASSYPALLMAATIQYVRVVHLIML